MILELLLISVVMHNLLHTIALNINETAEYRLYSHLFNYYNPSLRPRHFQNSSVQVEIEFELSTISGIDEVNQVISTSGFLVLNWSDDFLTWDPENYENVKNIVVPATKVWRPDCGIQNSARHFTRSEYWEDFRTDIRFDGRVIWKYGGNFDTYCTLDMTSYPFDTQRCDTIVENWAYTIKTVNLSKASDVVHLQEFSVNGEWNLDYSTVTESTYTEDTHPGELFPKVTFSLYLTRKFRYYSINILLPALFVIIIALGVFWLPPDSGEKVSLGITVLLAFSVFQLVIMDNTPKTSDYTPIMTILFTIIMGASTFSVLITILVLYYHHHGAESRPPAAVRYWAFHLMARILCMRRQISAVCEKRNNYDVDASDVSHNAAFSLENQNEKTGEHVPKIANEASKASSVTNSEKYLREILVLIKETKKKLQEKEEENDIIFEWKCLARIVDRTIFWFALGILLITVLLMLFTR